MKHILSKLFIAGLLCFTLESCINNHYEEKVIGQWRLKQVYIENTSQYNIPPDVLLLLEFDGVNYNNWGINLDSLSFTPTDTFSHTSGTYSVDEDLIMEGGTTKWKIDAMYGIKLNLTSGTGGSHYYYEKYP